MSKFSDIPLEDDTVLFLSKDINCGPLEACIQYWSWDGIKGWSVIFLSDDVMHETDEQLVKIVSRTVELDESKGTTVTRGDQYTFVNFNFDD